MDLAGRTIVVTGANTGIGKVTARELARRGAHVIFACRSLEKAEPVVAEIRGETGNDGLELIELDLADLASVRRCAEQLCARELPIHGLVNNAGLAGVHGLTRDGFELTFGTNHLGHYLFTRLLLDRLGERPGARIVNVASDSHYKARAIDWEALRSPARSRTGLTEYAVSKLANVLFTQELAHRLVATRTTTYAVQPGRVATDIWRRIPGPLRWTMKRFMLTAEQGAHSTIHCATAPALARETGRYYGQDGAAKPPSPLATDRELAVQLWTKSAEWVGLPA